MTSLNKYKFSSSGLNELKRSSYGLNWPVAYILNNDKEVYIGETSNAVKRINDHLHNEARDSLEDMYIIFDEKFNKSAILDIEALLIQYMSADKKYTLQNRNGGQSQEHDYYQKQFYIDSFSDIWSSLLSNNLAIHTLDFIKNSDLFKFSPFKRLTYDQYEISNDIIADIIKDINLSKTYLINGDAGTGKTVLAIYLVKTILDYVNNTYNIDDLSEYDEHYQLLDQYRKLDKFEIGLVIPVTPLRKTLKNVFSKIDGLKPSMVIGPSEVTKKHYDLLIVDEAHRLKRRKNLTGYHSFDQTNLQLNLDNDGDELDWVLLSSTKQILFYDTNQSVKPSDITNDSFNKRIYKHDHPYTSYYLLSQHRVKGGIEYIQFIKDLLNLKDTKYKIVSEKYDFKIFDNVDLMVKEIKKKNDMYDLCRVVAGYSWLWQTKNKSYQDIINNGLYDIEIDNYRYVWNSTLNDWINSDNSINEIGCIHTIQGYDLNYCGVIIGNEITYNKTTKQIEIRRDNYFDIKGKAGVNDDAELLKYITNIYKVLLSRGILGTYVYICDKDLKEYFLSKIVK